MIAGIDEVGRGPLAGPVFAAAVMIQPHQTQFLSDIGVGDSKKLSSAKRAAISHELWRLHDAGTVFVALGAASVREIDTINVLQATFLAMARAVGRLPEPPSIALVDGNRLPVLPCPAETRVGGDASEPTIAAASIVAKVARDWVMRTLAIRHPGYGWDRNAGYGTAEHLTALSSNGVTPHHRRSFAPVTKALAM